MHSISSSIPANAEHSRSSALQAGRIGRIESINRSDGGVPKEPVPEAFITASGVEGDRHNDLINHGGPERAVLLYSLELIQALQREGHPIRPGSAGENLTVSGLDWSLVVPGATIMAGEVQLQITRYASPCYKISDSFLAGDSSRISEKLHPGWSRAYSRVISGGLVRAGDLVEIKAPL